MLSMLVQGCARGGASFSVRLQFQLSAWHCNITLKLAPPRAQPGADCGSNSLLAACGATSGESKAVQQLVGEPLGEEPAAAP